MAIVSRSFMASNFQDEAIHMSLQKWEAWDKTE